MEEPSAGQAFPAVALDIFTLSATPFFGASDLASDVQGYYYIGTYVVNGRNTDIYVDLVGYELPLTYLFTFVERPSGRRGEIFPWVIGQEWTRTDLELSFRTRVWQSADGLLNLAVMQDYGLDLALGLTFDEAITRTSYAERMRRVSIPPGWGYPMPSSLLDLPNLIIRWISRDGGLLGIERLLHRSSRAMVLDADSLELREYCVEGMFQWQTFESPDASYLLWSIPSYVEGPEEGFASLEGFSAAVVLDLVTGRYATIDGAEALGWGVTEE
jgi:hypothetical protein